MRSRWTKHYLEILFQIIYSDGLILAAFTQFDGRRTRQSKVQTEIDDGTAVEIERLNCCLSLCRREGRILIDALLLFDDAH